MLKAVEPVVEAIMDITHKVYLSLNAASCSFLILNLIGFWNLSLLYIFNQVRSLPSFAYNMLEQMANLFFTRNTVTLWLSKLLTGE